MEHDYRYISIHSQEVQDAYDDLMQLLSETQEELEEYYTFQHKVVGSYSRNMITYDAKGNTGFDFDVNIYPHYDFKKYVSKDIKLLFKNALDKNCRRYGYDYAEDSTSVLTIKVKDRTYSRILYSVDFCFVHDYIEKNGETRQEYIHHYKIRDSYEWCLRSKGYHELPKKISWIKSQKLWGQVRNLYIEKKNSNRNPNLHSRTIFAKTINEICQQNGYFG